MAFARRWAVCVALAVSLALMIMLYSSYDTLSQPSFHFPSRPYRPPVIVDQDQPSWSWSQRKPHFPLSSYTPLPAGTPKKLPPVQASFPPETEAQRSSRLKRREKVQKVFERCWNSYRSKAWMYDELSPLSGSGRNTFGGWSATLVDALDTLWVMGMKQEFQDTVQAVTSINFSTSTDETINILETTIRYLGGFLSAYDLSGERVLLDKAIEVGEMLLTAFDTPNRMPITRWQWKVAKERSQPQQAPDWMLVSELGSLSLEFTRLSQITGDARWCDAVARITDLFADQQNRTKVPGMWPVVVNPKDKDLTKDTVFTLGGMSDSLYEYFPKAHALLGGLAPAYQTLYNTAMGTVTEQLLFRPMTPTTPISLWRLT